jgi:hypothetical protein
MTEMTQLEDAYIDDLRDTFQFITAFLWLYASLAIPWVLLRVALYLTGILFFYWSMSLHPDKCEIYVESGKFRWEQT